MFKFDGIEPENYPKTVKELLLYMVRPYKKGSFEFFSLTFLGLLCWNGSPFVIAVIVDKLAAAHHISSDVWFLVILYFVLRVLDESFWRLAEYKVRKFKPDMIERIRALLFSVALKKSYAYSVNSSSGQIGYWINQTTTIMNDVADSVLWSIWGRVISLIISAVFLFIINWSLAVLFIVWLVLLFWFNIVRGRKFAQLVALQSEEQSKASGLVVDALSNHLSVRTYNAQLRERKTLHDQQRLIVRRWKDSWWQNLITNIVKGQSAAIVSGIALLMVVLLYSHSIVPLGGILLFATYFGDASSSLWELAWSLDACYRNFGSIQNALNGLNGEDARVGEVVQSKHIPSKVSLNLKDLSFYYPDQTNEKVIDSINLEIPNGTRVGIVGHSGAGKSTLMGLVLGFYEPTEGHIFINDIDITSKDPSFSREVSSLVPQDTSLFNRSVRDNVAYAMPDATDSQIKSALKQARATEFVNKLPNGIDTLIGERGVKLSGGQRQRLAIARAILKDAPLLLLDEATSALDSVSEQAIQKALYELMENRTTIVIAHRLSTLKHLDKIIVLDKGKIAEQGTHDELVKQGGIYSDLWKRQKGGFLAE